MVVGERLVNSHLCRALSTMMMRKSFSTHVPLFSSALDPRWDRRGNQH